MYLAHLVDSNLLEAHLRQQKVCHLLYVNAVSMIRYDQYDREILTLALRAWALKLTL